MRASSMRPSPPAAGARSLVLLLLLVSTCRCTGKFLGGSGNTGNPGNPATSGSGGSTASGSGGSTASGSGGSGAGPRANPTFPADHPRIYLSSQAVRTRLTGRLTSGAAPAVRFQKMVDSQLSGTDNYNFTPWYAALMGQLTGNMKYCTYAVSQVDKTVAAEEALIAGGTNPEIAADSYLQVGEDVAAVALTYDWCGSTVSDSQRMRWLAYADQAVWNVWNPDQAKWGNRAAAWSGWSVDNPSDNYYYAFLRATMMLGLAARGEIANAQGWITMFRNTKIQSQLVPTFDSDLVGGGSREGTGYGVSMARLFDLYDWWEASTGERIHDLTPHTLASLALFLHQTVPTLDRVAPIGDQSRDSTAALFDYHRNYVQILAYLYQTQTEAPLSKWWLSHCSVPQMGQLFMYVYDFLYDEPSITEASSMDALSTAYFAPGIGQIISRSSWAKDATWMLLIAGPYTESHAHRDQGSILVYGNRWLAYDQNVQSHSGIRQEEEMHNLVRIVRSGATMQQKLDKAAVPVALVDDPAYTYAAVDVTPIYGDATVQKLQREVVFIKPGVIVLFDRVDVGSGAQGVFQLNTPAMPVVSGATATMGDLTVTRVLPATATTNVINWTTDSDMGGGFRLDVSGATRYLHVLSVRGAATSVTADGTGAAINLAGGGSATVHFTPDSFGGDLQIRSASGATTSATLAAGIHAPPLLAP